MSTSLKLAAFAALLVVMFGIGLIAGSIVGPIDTAPTETHGGM